MKVIKIVTTRCQILKIKFTKFIFGWDSVPDPAGGAYSTPPDPLAGFKGGPTSKGRGGKRWKWRERRGPLNFFLRIYAHDLHYHRRPTALILSQLLRFYCCPHHHRALYYRPHYAI